MIYKTYDEIVRHLDKHSKEPIYLSSIDTHTKQISNVRLNQGFILMVLTNDDEWVKISDSHSIYSDLEELDKPKKIKRKKK